MATPKTHPTVSDPKKRAFEALERRFTAAKAEHLQQQLKIKKRDTQEEDRSRSDCASPAPVLNPSSPHSVIHSSNKGRLASWSRTPSSGTPQISSGTPQASSGTPQISSGTPQASSGTPRVSDIETQGPAYSQLAQPVHENLLKTDFKLSGQRGSTAEKIMHELFRRGDSAHKYLQGSKSMKLDNWLLLDSIVQGRGTDRDARIKSFQSHSKRSKRHMSLQGHRKCGSFDLPPEYHKFDLFKPMHEMWKDYITQILKDTGKNQLSQCLLSADLHGAVLLVVECKVSKFTRSTGIMIRETAETFGIIREDNKFLDLILQLCPKRAPSSCFKLPVGRSHCLGTNFVRETLSNDVVRVCHMR